MTGDVMSPPNLDRLLVLPSGCGEQNLVRTATNWVVAHYLKTTDQLQDFIAAKIRNNLHTGTVVHLCYTSWEEHIHLSTQIVKWFLLRTKRSMHEYTSSLELTPRLPASVDIPEKFWLFQHLVSYKLQLMVCRHVHDLHTHWYHFHYTHTYSMVLGWLLLFWTPSLALSASTKVTDQLGLPG